MSYKTILLHLHDPRRAQRLLDATMPLARAGDAHVIALPVLPPYVVVPASEGYGASFSVEEHRVAYAKDLDGLRTAFEAAGRNNPTVKLEWRVADAGFDTAADQILSHGRCADLIVVSQRDPNWGYSTMLEDPERLAIESGRPLLMVPNGGPLNVPPRHVTIAWNGRREAARAVFDAVPLLRQAAATEVLWVNPENERRTAGDLPGSDLCAALARHGVKCMAIEIHAAGANAGAALLREARARGSDLIVMGAYGQSRLREYWLGGASRHVFEHFDRPVFMSH